MIHEYSLRLLQKAIQKALELDPDMPSKIQPLQDKIIKIIINPLRVHFYMVFENASITLYKELSRSPDTVIHSTPLGLIRLSLLPASKVRSLFNHQITITGDMLLGQDVKQLFDELEIDWEGYLAQFTGDVIAHQMGSFVRFGLNVKERLQTSLTHQVKEYLQEEAQLSPPHEEISDFMNDVDELSLKLARLEAHLNHYMTYHEDNNATDSTAKN